MGHAAINISLSLSLPLVKHLGRRVGVLVSLRLGERPHPHCDRDVLRALLLLLHHLLRRRLGLGRRRRRRVVWGGRALLLLPDHLYLWCTTRYAYTPKAGTCTAHVQ